ncbi:hypothetical protein DWF00_24890 [Bosea caraganae]|nr:hypothetical protein DWF00_24890 [Bosea caraganae]
MTHERAKGASLSAIDRETAVEFDKRINLALRYLFLAGNEVRGHIEREQSKALDRALGRACAELDSGVLELIYRAHPDLRPDFLGGTRRSDEFENGE